MKLGIVGLPNVGKSTLFNAITNAGAASANYPFCTIDPDVYKRQINNRFEIKCMYVRYLFFLPSQ